MSQFGRWISLVLVVVTSGSVFAQNDRPAGKSAKKIAVDAVPSREPQVLEKGDSTFGLRASQGGIYANQALMGVMGEHMVTPNVGLGGGLSYTHYKDEFVTGPMHAEWDYSVYSLIGVANFHTDMFKVRNLDTYFSFGFGHSFLNAKWKTNITGEQQIGNGDESANFFVAYATARYFLNSQWGITGSVGTGVGSLSAGMDYLF